MALIVQGRQCVINYKKLEFKLSAHWVTFISGTHPDELLHLKFYARKLLYFVRSHGLQKFWSDFKDKEPNNPSDGNYLEGLVRNPWILSGGSQVIS